MTTGNGAGNTALSPEPGHSRPGGVDDATVAALGKLVYEAEMKRREQVG